MNKILPAILPDSYEELEAELGFIAKSAQTVHLDVCDGVFAPRTSWPYLVPDDAHFELLLREDEGLPYWDKLDYEAHLMIENAEAQAEEWVRVGMSRLIVHAETLRDFDGLATQLGPLTELGLALKYETSLDVVAPYIDRIAVLQLMTISDIGFRGSAFESDSFERVAEARKRFPNVVLAVDGGVNRGNIKALKESGADRFVIGSALFSESDIPRALRELEGIIGGHDAHS